MASVDVKKCWVIDKLYVYMWLVVMFVFCLIDKGVATNVKQHEAPPHV